MVTRMNDVEWHEWYDVLGLPASIDGVKVGMITGAQFDHSFDSPPRMTLEVIINKNDMENFMDYMKMASVMR